MENEVRQETTTALAQQMQAEKNKLLQAMGDEQLCEIVSNCIDELERREYSVLISISNPDKSDSTIYMDCSGVPEHLAAGLMYLSINRKIFGAVVSTVADKLAHDRAFYEKKMAEYGLAIDEETDEEADDE